MLPLCEISKTTPLNFEFGVTNRTSDPENSSKLFIGFKSKTDFESIVQMDKLIFQFFLIKH